MFFSKLDRYPSSCLESAKLHGQNDLEDKDCKANFFLFYKRMMSLFYVSHIWELLFNFFAPLFYNHLFIQGSIHFSIFVVLYKLGSLSVIDFEAITLQHTWSIVWMNMQVRWGMLKEKRASSTHKEHILCLLEFWNL